MSEWIDYKSGDYEKKWYDIKTMAGHTYYGCWPNAGSFNIGSAGRIDEAFVIKVRVSRLDDIGMPARSEP